MSLAVVIMAAGMGTRMRSRIPKVLHPVLGKPMLRHIVDAVRVLDPIEIVAVVGYEADQVQAEFEEITFALQSPQLGTGHAVQQAQFLLEGKADIILVVPGDLPLLSTETLQNMVAAYQSVEGPVMMLTVERPKSRGFGRVVRDAHGFVIAVVEEVDCTPEQKAIRELNVGAYVFEAGWLWQNLKDVPLSSKGEYFITDLIEVAARQGKPVRAELMADPVEALGINNRVHLAEVEAALRQKINRKWMEAGVTMIDPLTSYIGLEVTIGPDTTIYPNTFLLGDTTIGRDCIIGPNSFIEASTIGDNCLVRFSFMEQAILEDQVDIGPFARLRKGAHLARGVHMGNFGEVKNAYLGQGTKMGHFSYLGDITTGENVNIGAGTITCNYDGINKYPTTIGDSAFIGSDTMLVAPVNIGKNAQTGAGSVVTRDVPDNSLAYGVPARVKKSDDEKK